MGYFENITFQEKTAVLYQHLVTLFVSQLGNIRKSPRSVNIGFNVGHWLLESQI